MKTKPIFGIIFIAAILVVRPGQLHGQNAPAHVAEVTAANECLELTEGDCRDQFEEAVAALKRVQNDTLAVNEYLYLGNRRMRTGRFDTYARELFEKGLARAKESEVACKIAESQFAITRYSRFMGETEVAFDLATKSKEAAENCGDVAMIARSEVFLGSAYLQKSNYKEALKHFQESERLYASIADSSGMAGLMLDYAVLYSEMREKPKALTYTKRAANIFKQTGEEIKYAIALIDLSADLIDLNLPDTALIYLPLAEEIIVGKHARANAYLEQNYGGAFHQLGDDNTAIIHYKKALVLAEDISDISLMILVNNFISESYRALSQYQESYQFALVADSLSRNGPKNLRRAQTLSSLARAAHHVGNHDQSHKYFISYVNLRDSLLGAEKRKEIATLEQAYEAEKREAEIALQKKENALLEQKNTAATERFIALASIMGLLVFLGFALFSRQRNKAKVQKAQLELKELEYEKLNQEVKFKNRELTSKALEIARNNEMLKELRTNLENLKTSQSSKEVQSLLRELDINKAQSNNWQDFANQFNELNPQFYKSLTSKNSDLTKSEIRLAALLRMGLSSKDIASMLNISEDGIKKARYRLRKKLDLSSEDGLEMEIMKL